MAITNAQQYKQLVNPPMKGKKRPGYRGEGGYQGGRSDTPAGAAPAGDVEDRSTAQQTANTRAAIAEAQRAQRIADIEKFIDRPPVGFGEKFRTNLLSPKSVAKTAFGKIVGIPGLGFLSNINVNPTTTDDDEDDDRGNGDGQSIFLPQMMAQAPSIMAQGPEEEKLEGLRLAFRAQGGIIDEETGRQMYGLGKLVKKATRAVKKIAKSDLGKAALIGAAAFGIPGTGLGGIFGRASFGGYAPGMFGFGGIGNAIAAGKAKFLSKPFTKTVADFGLDRQAFNAARTAAGTSGGGLGIGTLIGGAAIAAGMLTPAEENEAQQLADSTGIDIEAARNSIIARAQGNVRDDFRARRFRAEGGSMKEPVAKKTMPLLDMGGKEMDLRAEGGFVPIGRMEKADDVPARLSKNEFVFTADAVRNAGDGSVDKGAEVMYNMMKNLEAGGDVSEESQGLEGARKMFQTSQRLEEVL